MTYPTTLQSRMEMPILCRKKPVRPQMHQNLGTQEALENQALARLLAMKAGKSYRHFWQGKRGDPDSNGGRFPRKVTLDGHVPSRMALWRLRHEHVNWRHVKVRTSQYLNNIVEQDHRGIKARLRPTKGLKSFASAAITIAGFELAHRIRKRQFSFRRRGHRYTHSRQINWQIALA